MRCLAIVFYEVQLFGGLKHSHRDLHYLEAGGAAGGLKKRALEPTSAVKRGCVAQERPEYHDLRIWHCGFYMHCGEQRKRWLFACGSTTLKKTAPFYRLMLIDTAFWFVSALSSSGSPKLGCRLSLLEKPGYCSRLRRQPDVEILCSLEVVGSCFLIDGSVFRNICTSTCKEASGVKFKHCIENVEPLYLAPEDYITFVEELDAQLVLEGG